MGTLSSAFVPVTSHQMRDFGLDRGWGNSARSTCSEFARALQNDHINAFDLLAFHCEIIVLST